MATTSKEAPAAALQAPLDPGAMIGELADAKAKWKNAAKGMAEKIKTLEAENTEYKAKAINPDDAVKRIAELEAKIRDRQHYDRFTELAQAAKVKAEAVKHLWQLSGYKAEADEPDENALGEVITRLKTEASYAFDSEQSTAAGASGAKPVPGGGRGARSQGQDGTVLTADMLADPKFMLDPRNREFISVAAKKREEQRGGGPYVRTSA